MSNAIPSIASSRVRALILAMLITAVCAGVSAQAAGAAATLQVSTDSHAAGADTGLTITTALSGTGNDTHQYGASVTLSSALRISPPAYGTPAQECPSTSFSSTSSGLTPASLDAFDATG